MSNFAELERLVSRLSEAPNSITLTPGLTSGEVAMIEAHFEFTFPRDLRHVLEFALPVGDVPKRSGVIKNGSGFPNWRELGLEVMREQMSWPIEGVIYDVERNGFWLKSWGNKPPTAARAIETAREALTRLPKLIPVYGHRYICESPPRSGNPVLSVWQTDIIYYGGNLQDYLMREFYGERDILAQPSKVPGWSQIIDA